MASDASRKAALAEAKDFRMKARDTFDSKVRRAHEAGAMDSDIARELKCGTRTVKASRDRQNLKANPMYRSLG